MKSVFILIFSSLFIQNVACGQSCGTEIDTAHLNYLTSRKDRVFSRTSGIDDGLVRIPIKIHVIRRDDASGGISLQTIQSALDITNDWFINANMEFFVYEDVNHIDNTIFYNMDRSEEDQVANPNDVRNVINMYFAGSLSSGGNALCGYATFPGGKDRVFMANGCTPNGTTLAHELGHYFNLYHPHETAFGRELVDGSNCENTGDILCSTPADPNLTGLVDANCNYTGTATDSNGMTYAPLVNNIMAYSPDNCQDRMTKEQYERMRFTLENDRDYLLLEFAEFSLNFSQNVREGCYPLTVEFSDFSVGAFSRAWTFEGGTPSTSTERNPVIIFEEPGSYDVSLEISNTAGDQLFSLQENAVISLDPKNNSSRESIINKFDQIELERDGWIIENTDPNRFFEASNATIDGSGFSLLLNNFNNDNIGEIELLKSPILDYDDISSVNVEMDVSYSTYIDESTLRSDTLEILFKDFCAENWQVLTRLFGEELQTTATGSDIEFIPSVNDWESKSFTFTRDNLIDWSSMQFGISVINGSGNNLYIDNIIISPNYIINTPEIISISDNNAGNNIIAWNDNSNNEQGFVIERRASDEVEFSVHDSLVVNATIYADLNNEKGLIYSYRVRAYGLVSSSEYSNEVDNSDLITSLPESIAELESSVKIYPNPTDQVLNISSVKYIISSVTIFDLYGREVFYDRFNSLEATINVENYPKGTYLIVLNESSEMLLKKLIVIQ
ncbi:MAG: T9SS type A sorting domain-containing protein [Bacteroidota bacterium]